MQTINRPSLRNDGKGPKRSTDPTGLLTSKNGSVAAALLAAVLAGAVLLLFLDRYREGLNDDAVPTGVLVAGAAIDRGASGETIGQQKLFKPSEVPKDQVEEGAITDAADLRGKVAAADILPGQQLTARDFRPAGSGVITKLGPDERALAIPLDRAHGLIGPLKLGDRVDVLSGFLVDTGSGRSKPVLRTIAQDVLVLEAPARESGGRGGANATKEVVLRVDSGSAPKIAFASEYGKVWLALRPANGALVDKRSLVTIETLVFGDLANAKSLKADRPAR